MARGPLQAPGQTALKFRVLNKTPPSGYYALYGHQSKNITGIVSLRAAVWNAFFPLPKMISVRAELIPVKHHATFFGLPQSSVRGAWLRK